MHDQFLSPSDPNMLATCLRPSLQDRRLKPHADQILKCPRCDSLNTKFCYYNNYSLTQPRHFCKNCKRYWTQGGALRNVPVGGGCRSSKNKRTSKQQRSTDQYHHTTTPSHAEDDQRLFSGCTIHGDGSSSSSSLQQDFSARASTERDGAFGLTFERLDQATRAFSVSTAPFSISWQAPATFNLPPFDSNMLALNLTGHHLKQEATNHPQNSDLTCMYESHLNLVAPPSSLHENIPAYNLCLESCGVAGSNVDLQWRLPPRLVTVAGEEEGSNGRQLMQSMEDVERVRPAKGKLPLECMPVSSTELDEHGWHPSEDGFFEATADGGYWNNGSGPPDMTMYGMTGSQLL